MAARGPPTYGFEHGERSVRPPLAAGGTASSCPWFSRNARPRPVMNDARVWLRTPMLIGAIGLGNVLLVAVLYRGGGFGRPLIIAFLPLALIILGVLFSAHRELLVFAGLALPMTFDALGDKKFPLGGGFGLFSSDIILLLAVVPWLASRIVGRRDLAPNLPRTPVRGWPLLLFSAALLQAVVRGHYNYGSNLISQPLRMILYALIAAALVGIDAKRALRGVTIVFYAGTVYIFLYAMYLLAAGKTITGQGDLSTGGTRVLAGTIAQAMASAFVLGLINLRLDTSAKRRALHLSMVLLSGTNIALSLQRATFLALAVVLPLLFVTVRRIAGPLASMLPLALPFLAIVAMFLPQVAPTLAPTFITRITGTSEQDSSLQARERLATLQWEQAKTSPLIGAGFGEELQVHVPITDSRGFTVYKRDTAGQEGHNSYFWYLAAGGFGLLFSFLLIIGAYVVDTAKRLVSTKDEHERLLLVWSAVSVFVVLLNAAAGPSFAKERTELALWIFLLLPSIVPHRPRPHRLLRAR